MRATDAKLFAAELESNRYWRVESISEPYNVTLRSPWSVEQVACVTVVVVHKTRRDRWTNSGVTDAAIFARLLVERGPTPESA